MCSGETLKLSRLSPIGTGAPAQPGDSGCGAGIMPCVVFGGDALRLALKPVRDWQEGPTCGPLGQLENAVENLAHANSS